MPIVNITLSNKNFSLCCNDGEEELLRALSREVSDKINLLRESNKSASFELLLVLLGLSLQEEVASLTTKIQKLSDNNILIQQEQLADTLGQIASYLEELARKMNP
jgi:cell division protein ZapA